MNNSRFDLPARNSIPVNEPGSAAYRRLQRAKKGRPIQDNGANRPWGGKKPAKDQAPTKQNMKNLQRPVKGKKR